MAEQSTKFDARLDLVPQNPGVYLMKDAAGSVIYVGKALNLQNRLRSYFTPNPQGTAKVLAMISHIADFTTIICQNEFEALVLECNLIKEHQPHYNILLRDDRAYPYIRITMNELYPRILKAFRIGPDRKLGARYYGPYLGGGIFHALNTLRDTFPIKTCKRVLPRDIGKERPCLNYYIGRCIGPCRGDVSAESYRKVMSDICRFLEGRYDGLLQQMRDDMAAASEDLRFEEAAVLRDRIASLDRLMARQEVVSSKEQDKDVIGIASNQTEHCLLKLEIRSGRMIGSSVYFFPEDGSEREAVLEAYCLQHYPDAALVPPTVLIPLQMDSQSELAAFLTGIRGGKVVLRMPQRGDDVRLLKMANDNAREALRRQTLAGAGANDLNEALQMLRASLGLTGTLARIEAFDISHHQGSDQAASMVVFQDGRPRPSLYRHFAVDEVAGADDVAALTSVVRRRLGHLKDDSFGSRPDLLLIDGGRLQVDAIVRLLSILETDIPVAGLVKDDRHRTRGLVRSDGQILELRRSAPDRRQTRPAARHLLRDSADAPAYGRLDAVQSGSGQPDDQALPDEPLLAGTGGIAPEDLSLLRLLTAIQDEAHRFAGQYRQKRTKKRQTRFTLEGIPGIGPVRRKALLTRFSSIKAISEADETALSAVPEVDAAAARAVYRHFHPDRED